MPTLNWLSRDEDIVAASKVPYRLLEEVPEHSCAGRDPATENMLIQGDNLEALKSLLPFYAGKVKCIFIDPPYNTGNDFGQYDDNLKHTQWLSMIYPRVELLRELVSEDGSLWVTIDDNEAQYLKVVMDEVFGRANFIASVIWRKNYAPKSSAQHFSVDHDYLLVYAKSATIWRPNPMPRSAKQDRAYKNFDDDPRGLWRPNNLAARNFYSKGTYEIKTPGGRIISGPPAGSYWRVSAGKLAEMDKEGRIWWGKSGNNVPAPKIYLTEVKQGIVPQTYWDYTEVGHTQDAKKEAVQLFSDDVFGTPKPEMLLSRVCAVATSPGELVLDSFLGSGTTAAVAHKMGRRYIGIEMGDHAVTHCATRLRKVVEGEQGGVSEAVGWKGGGGFRFYRLGEQVFDEEGRIHAGIRFEHLAAHVWFSETRTPRPEHLRTPLLGVHEGTAYYLLYNGVLGDRRPDGGNVLTRAVLADLPVHDGPRVIYGESSRLRATALKAEGLTFKQTPYDVRAR